jgi:hypothetical protein
MGVGIHLSPQILTEAPFPILQKRPCFKRFQATKILLQAYEGRFPREASKKDELGKYLAFNMLPKREEGFWQSLQPCLAKRALLKQLRSLKPIPPILLDLPIFSQDIQ